MSPYEHGEVFVLDDGGEADLDLGNYERFLGVKLTRMNNITTGKVYQTVIDKERRGDYLGKTVQIVPHVTGCIKVFILLIYIFQEWILSVSHIPINEKGDLADICLVEVGGTVGDIESSIFLEAIRQLIQQLPREDCCLGFVSLVPCLGEQKTKPTQHGVTTLRSLGLFPDILALRCAEVLEEKTKEKIALFTNVLPENCFSVHNCPDIYYVPYILNQQNAAEKILKKFNLPLKKEINVDIWKERADYILDDKKPLVHVAFVGKYTQLADAYLSVRKALLHATLHTGRFNTSIDFVESLDLEDPTQEEKYNEAWKTLKECDCVLVPGGFGNRGAEGMILAIKYARENKIPYLGICLGMQLAVVEYARYI